MSRLIRNQVSRAHRRGNSIVLVSALLVMLVIIATAYVTRTNAGRVTARAVRTAEARESNAETIAEMLAQIPADALFAAPVDPNYRRTDRPIDANAPRLPIEKAVTMYGAAPRRYSIDINYNGADFDGNGFADPSLHYNFAPMWDVPFTNWPDEFTIVDTYGLNAAEWPRGPGNPSGTLNLAFLHEGNPVGNPGFADNRWMRDFEPVRIDLDTSPPFGNGSDGRQDAFSHWRHLTYLAMPNNHWRVCRDISDITDVTGFGGIVEDLNIPIEQWLAAPNDQVDFIANNAANAPATGNSFFGPDAFGRWLNWSGSLAGYINQLTGALGTGDTTFAPGNFYRLRDLDASFYPHTYFITGIAQDRPESERIPNTARDLVTRYLADTDGDGYTDAFWHLVPLPVKDGVRMVAAVSIIPNNAMINVNTATRFQYTDNAILLQGGNAGPFSRTKGHTPADIALVGAAASGFDFANWNVGFYDDPLNHYRPTGFIPGRVIFDYSPSRWPSHISDVGLAAGALNQVQRLDYWRRSGIDPLSASANSLYQPFSLGDDLELRMFYGQDYEWIRTRYEHSVQKTAQFPELHDHFLRATSYGGAETSEFGNQLSNRTLVADSRHRITMYSAVRNELMPHWLQYRWGYDVNGDGFFNFQDLITLPVPIREDIVNFPAIAQATFNRFYELEQHKIDLREPTVFPDGVTPYHNGINAAGAGWLSLRERLPYALLHALDDGPRLNGGNITGNSYHGSYNQSAPSSQGDPTLHASEFGRTRRMAASFTANMLAYRDADSRIHISDDPTTPQVEGPVPLPAVSTLLQQDDDRRFMGMEPQPFLVEAFIGHVYKGILVPDADFQGHEYTNAGNYMILHEDGRQSTVVVVQIANPFDEPIYLPDYKISVFGQEFDLEELIVTLPEPDRWLLPAYAEQPNTAIFYAMKDDIGGDNILLKWSDFLDIEPADLTANSLVYRVESAWDTERAQYDAAPSDEHAVALLRKVENPVGSGSFVDVLLDRFEPAEDPADPADHFRGFAEDVNDLEDDRPPDLLNDPPDLYDVPPFGAPYQDAPEWDIGPNYNHWVQWVRMTRAWGVDVDNDGLYQHDERSPRYVFGTGTFHSAKSSADPDPNMPADDRFFHGGNRYDFDVDPDDDGTYSGAPPRPVPWFRRDYNVRDSMNNPVVTSRKPTFFDMNSGDQSGFPDKGWYSQGRNEVRRNMVDVQVVANPNTTNIRLNFPMQMAHKNGDFEQIGEVLNVWLWGHEMSINCPGAGLPCSYDTTFYTFSEHVARLIEVAPNNQYHRTRINRLTMGEQTLGVSASGSNVYDDQLVSVPNQPAGARVMDLFVCDGYGANLPGDVDGNGTPNQPMDYEFARFSNANDFTGRAVHGLISLNAAPPEVMRALPHWSRLIYESGHWSRCLLPEAVVQYRERFDDDIANKRYVWRTPVDSNGNGIFDLNEPFDSGPDYSDRDAIVANIDDMRTDRGFASVGELLMLNLPGSAPDPVDANKWSINYAGLNPYARLTNNPNLNRASVRLSTDVVEDYRRDVTGDNPNQYWDEVAGDAEERNMLFAGVSSLVTTRTDTFTIYFRLRAFKQNPVSGRWDATDPEYIVDDSRYVMLIDRSNVNEPGDKPKILYFEKLPN